MLHGALIAVAESIAIIIALFTWHRWMTKCLMVIRVCMTVTFCIAAGGFNAVLKSLTSHIAKLVGGLIPGSFLPRDRG